MGIPGSARRMKLILAAALLCVVVHSAPTHHKEEMDDPFPADNMASFGVKPSKDWMRAPQGPMPTGFEPKEMELGEDAGEEAGTPTCDARHDTVTEFCSGDSETTQPYVESSSTNNHESQCNGGSVGGRSCQDGSNSYCCYWKAATDTDAAFCDAKLWVSGSTAECDTPDRR